MASPRCPPASARRTASPPPHGCQTHRCYRRSPAPWAAPKTPPPCCASRFCPSVAYRTAPPARRACLIRHRRSAGRRHLPCGLARRGRRGAAAGRALRRRLARLRPPLRRSRRAARRCRGRRARRFLDWGGGLVWLAGPADAATHRAVQHAAGAARGTWTLLRAPDALRVVVDVVPPEAAPLARITRQGESRV